MEKITPRPISKNCEQELKWITESETNTLYDYQSSDLIRLLIVKLNQLSSEVDYLRNRVDKNDSFI